MAGTRRWTDKFKWGSTGGGIIEAGTSSVPLVIKNASDPLVQIHTTHSLLAGIVRSMEIVQTQTVADVSIVNEALYVSFESAVTTGEWANAIVGRISFTAPGKADGGMAAAICSEMNMPAAAQTGGVYCSLDVEMNCPTSFTHAANTALPVSFIRFGLWGGAAGEFDDHGVLFHIEGVTAGDGHVFDTTPANADFAADAALKINVKGTEYWIGLCDQKSCVA